MIKKWCHKIVRKLSEHFDKYPLITAIETMTIAPGDILLCQLPPRAHMEAIEQTTKLLKKTVPEGVKVVVAPNDVKFKKIVKEGE